MLEYAVGRPPIAARPSSPHAMLVVISIHVALLAVVMSARMDLPRRIGNNPIIVDLLRNPPPPPERRSAPIKVPQSPPDFTRPERQIELPSVGQPEVPPSLPLPGEVGGPSATPGPTVIPRPSIPVGATSVARLLTPAAQLKPPYPPSKLLSEEEAVLKLRLTIDDQGRVVAVEAIGRADPVFLEAARRHLISRWR